MAAYDPRMFQQMHAAGNMHPNMLNSVNMTPQRYPHHVPASTANNNQAVSSSGTHPQQPKAGAMTPESKIKAGPGWENTYRTAQNIAFPDPKAACGDRVGEFVEDLARGIGCPVEYVLVPLLPCIGGLLGTNTTVRVHRAWAEPPILWSIVGASGGSRRSAVIRQLLAPILRLQAEQRQAEERTTSARNDVLITPTLVAHNMNGQDEEEGTRTEKIRRLSVSGQKRALYSGTRITLAALTEVLHRNDGHAFSLTENVENLHEMLGLMQTMTSPRLVSVMEDLYEGLPLVAVEDGRVTTILGSNFCHGGFASPEYMVALMLKSPPWLSARLLLSCPQADDMKGVFGEPGTDVDLPELAQVYSILLSKHQGRETYTFDTDAVQELSKFFDEEWSTVLNQLDQNEHEGIIGKSMGQIVRLCGILKALENGIIVGAAQNKGENWSWDWGISIETVKNAIALGKYFLEQKLAMTFMVGTGFFSNASMGFLDGSGNDGGNAMTLPQTAIQDGMDNPFQSGSYAPPKSSASQNSSPMPMAPIGTPRSLSQDVSSNSQPPFGSQQSANSPFGLPKQPGEVDFSTLPHTMTTVEEDVSEMMQAVDFVHFSKTQFVAVHGRRIKRLLECYDDGHGVSATTAAQKSITPPVRIEGTNNRHPAWASALFFQKVAELELGTAEQGRHPTNRKVCWRFKRKPVSQLSEKDFQLLQYLRVEMDKYSQFGSGPFNPSMIVNSGLITVPHSNSPGPHQHLAAMGAGSSPRLGSLDDDSNSQSSSHNPGPPIIKSEVF